MPLRGRTPPSPTLALIWLMWRPDLAVGSSVQEAANADVGVRGGKEAELQKV